MSFQEEVAENPHVVNEDFFGKGRLAARIYRGKKMDATAVVGFNDEFSLGLICGFQEMGLRVPEDISVMGIDGNDARKYVSPLLTTVSLFPQEQGAMCVRVLLDLIEGKKGQICNPYELPAAGGRKRAALRIRSRDTIKEGEDHERNHQWKQSGARYLLLSGALGQEPLGGGSERMLEAGIRVIRIAEFAWNKIEPREGEYTYEFFDSFLDVVEKTSMKVIFCTPTATPPAWLVEEYPEVLNAQMDGTLYRHGARRHYNYNSPIYQRFAANITEKSASHYGSRPSIIGWQIDNELNCETSEFYSDSDTVAFREFLKKKYGTIEALNEAWGTVFWNQTYTAWSEVYVPQTTISNSTNPHRVLDYLRFISDSACRFAGLQARIIRKYKKPEDFITTNGLFGNLDNHRMTEESLDFITYDSYPNFAYCLDAYDEKDLLKDRKWSRNLTETRAISPNFGIMEQQSGANGWNTRMEAPTPRPGQMTLWTMQSIAHGADYVSYFRWRTCTVGTEIYWHGILDYSGRENRRLRELRDIHKKMEGLQEIAGSVYEEKVGILKDYDNTWDAQLDKWHERVERESQKNLFAAAQLMHTPVDFVYLTERTTLTDLQKYELLFYPHAVILTKERMALLEDYVRGGGKLVMGCRTGYKDLNGRCVMDYLPGLAAELTGTDIPEYSFVAPDEGKVYADWDGEKMEAAVFNDILAPAGGKR